MHALLMKGTVAVYFRRHNHNLAATEATKNNLISFSDNFSKHIQCNENVLFSFPFQLFLCRLRRQKMRIVVKNDPLTNLFDLQKCVDSF